VDSFVRAQHERNRLAEEARQADLLEGGRNTRHGAEMGLGHAQLGETTRHAMQTEEQARAALAQQQAEKQAASLAVGRELIAKGAPPEMIRQWAAEHRRLGGQVEEEMDQGQAPPPKQLGAFGGMNARMGMVPPPEPVAPPPTPSGRFRVGADGRQDGTLDVPGTHAAMREQNRPMLDASIRGARPIDQGARKLAALTVGQLPLMPADAAAAAQNIAEPQLRNETSERNARAQAASTGERFGAGEKRRNLALINSTLRQDIANVRQSYDVPGLHRAISGHRQIETLLSGDLSKLTTAQKQGFMKVLTSYFGKASSNRELEFLRDLNAEGKIMQGVNYWIGGGELDPNLMSQLLETSRELNDRAVEQLERAGKHAEGSVMANGVIQGLDPMNAPMWAKQASGAVVGFPEGYEADPVGTPGGESGAGGGTSSSVSARGDIVPGPGAKPLGDYLQDGYEEGEE
jgi:hypothetical protein